MPEWINRNDRLPEKNGLYLCLTRVNGQNCYQICLWHDKAWRWGNYVLYWMPLPEPPEEASVDA